MSYRFLTQEELADFWERKQPFVLCETYRAHYGYDGKCPCTWEHCDNKGCCLPKRIGLI